jgi:diguanylate cyclase (GGDEF)-like protein
VIASVALLPILAIGYFAIVQDTAPRFVHHEVHEIAVAIAIAQSAFIAFVSWRCYVASGEPLLRWFTLAFVSFTLIYALHGVFTPLADDHIWLFLLYGPISRLVMAICLLAGVAAYGRAPHAESDRGRWADWMRWLGIFVAIDVGVGLVASTWPESELMKSLCGAGADLLKLSILAMPTQTFRLLAEVGAMGLSLAGVALILVRAPRSPLMLLTAIALAYSAEASLAFVIAKPWQHLWWLAHLISAACFTLLSYGVIRAYHTTQAFALVFSQEEVMRQLASAKTNAEALASRLEEANKHLQVQATVDPLTKLSNRRHFLENAEIEVARAHRSQATFAVLALDLDHFKNINDNHGHAVGDAVLGGFAELARNQLRPTDHIGRVGGEEFLILLPDLGRDDALLVAERIRSSVEDIRIPVEDGHVAVTVSIGLALFPEDGEHFQHLYNAADERLYRAKRTGRNCCVGN